jgi:hypothetical protein
MMNAVIASHVVCRSRTESGPLGVARQPLFLFSLSGWV